MNCSSKVSDTVEQNRCYNLLGSSDPRAACTPFFPTQQGLCVSHTVKGHLPDPQPERGQKIILVHEHVEYSGPIAQSDPRRVGNIWWHSMDGTTPLPPFKSCHFPSFLLSSLSFLSFPWCLQIPVCREASHTFPR